MNIPFEGRISNRDLSAIFTLAVKNQRWLAYVFGPQFLVFTAMVIFSIINNVYSPLWFVASVLSGVLASCPFWIPALNANNTYKRQPDLRGVYSGAVSEDEIILRTTNATSNVKWKLYTTLIRNNEHVLLYQNPRCFNFFPRSFFSTQEDWRQLNVLLDQKVKSGELKETTGKVDLSLGTTLPGWVMLLAVGVLAIPFVSFIFALIVGIFSNLSN